MRSAPKGRLCLRQKARTIEKRRTGKDFVRDRSFEMHEMEKTKGTERNSMKKGWSC